MFRQDQKNNPKKHPLNRTEIILTIIRALWGEVSPALREVRISWDEETFHLLFYYDGEVLEEDYHSVRRIATGFIEYYSGYRLRVDILRLDYPKLIPQKAELIYSRRERT